MISVSEVSCVEPCTRTRWARSSQRQVPPNSTAGAGVLALLVGYYPMVARLGPTYAHALWGFIYYTLEIRCGLEIFVIACFISG